MPLLNLLRGTSLDFLRNILRAVGDPSTTTTRLPSPPPDMGGSTTPSCRVLTSSSSSADMPTTAGTSQGSPTLSAAPSGDTGSISARPLPRAYLTASDDQTVGQRFQQYVVGSTRGTKPPHAHCGDTTDGTFRRLLFSGPDGAANLTNFEQALLQNVSARLCRRGVILAETVFRDTAELVRLLQACNWDTEGCVERTLRHLEWRQRRLSPDGRAVDGIAPDDLTAPRLCYVFGHDRRYQPVIVSRLKLISRATSNDSAFAYVLSTVTRAVSTLMVPGRVERFTVIVDVEGFSVFGLASLAAKNFIAELQDNFPERLHKLYVVNVTAAFAVQRGRKWCFWIPIFSRRCGMMSAERNSRYLLVENSPRQG